MKKLGIFLGIILLMVGRVNAQTCTITATVKTGANQLANGFPITLVKVIKNGLLISRNPIVYRTNSSGVALIPVACNSSPFIYANAFGLDRDGTAGVMLSVGATDDTLENLASAVTIFSSLNQIIYSSSSLKPLALNPNVSTTPKFLTTLGNGSAATQIGYYSILGGAGTSVATDNTAKTVTFTLTGTAVSSVFGRTGVVTAQSGDYTFAQIATTPTTLAGYGIVDAAPLVHTHTATQISDSTAAGRTLLTAADASAQRTALGLAAVASSGSASDLSAGTVPDARFPATLPAISGVNLTALNASNISSGSMALARIAQGGASSGQALTWNGSAWVPGSGGAMAIGGTVTGGTANNVLFAATGPVLAQDGDFAYTASTKALRLGPASAATDFVELQASNGSGKPQIRFFDQGLSDLNIQSGTLANGTTQALVTSHFRATTALEAGGTFSATQLTSQDAASPRLRIWKTSVHFFDWDGATSSTLRLLNTSGQEIMSFADTTGAAKHTSQSISAVPLTIRLASGQTANALNIENSVGTGLSGFDASGKLGVGTIVPSTALHVVGVTTLASATNRHEFSNSNGNNEIVRFRNTAASNPYGLSVSFSAAAPNNTTEYFAQFADNAATRLTFFSNGSIVSAAGGTFGAALSAPALNGIESLLVSKNQTAETLLRVLNSNTSAGASATIKASNSASATALIMFGTGYTPSGLLRADGAYFYAGGAGGLTINTEAAQPIYFGVNNAEKMRLDPGGNLGIGATSFGTAAAKVLALADGTAPTTSPANTVQIYSETGEAKVRDAAGNITTFSPHNFRAIPNGPSEPMAWAYHSVRDDVEINVDMLRVIRLLEQLSGEKLVFLRDKVTGQPITPEEYLKRFKN